MLNLLDDEKFVVLYEPIIEKGAGNHINWKADFSLYQKARSDSGLL